MHCYHCRVSNWSVSSLVLVDTLSDVITYWFICCHVQFSSSPVLLVVVSLIVVTIAQQTWNLRGIECSSVRCKFLLAETFKHSRAIKLYNFGHVCRHGNRGVRGSNDPLLEIYLGVKCGILTPRFLERNIFWCTGQLIHSKIIKIVATSCQILRLKCTKFDFGWAFAPDPAGGAYGVLPDSLAGFKGASSKCGTHDFDPPPTSQK